MFGFGSMAVDWGRVQLAKSQLQHAADAAARFGAIGLENDSATARANAIAVAAQNLADGTPVALDPALDISFGSWDSTTHKFTAAAAGAEDSATTVKVTARRLASRGNPIPLMLAQVLGYKSCDVSVTSIAVYTRGQQTQMDVSSNSNPWLSGMPYGTVANPGNPHNNPDYAGNASDPKQSPVQVTSVPIVPGKLMSFDSINGGANNFNTRTLFTPDGNTAWLTDNLLGAEHGHSDVFAPINAVMGVFLGPGNPETDGVSVPPNLDFSSPGARNFQTLSPQLKQVFFIGDGRSDDGSTQTFVVPQGATRLFIGTMDEYEWNNNVGDYKVTIHRLGSVSLVK